VKLQKLARISEIPFNEMREGMRLLLCKSTQRYPLVVDMVKINTIYTRIDMQVRHGLSTIITPYKYYCGIKVKNNLGEETELVLYDNYYKQFLAVRKSLLPLMGEYIDTTDQYYTFFTF
jgi:hypothetical protein